MDDWRKEIGVAHLVKQRVAELDREGLWPYHLPEVAASEEDLVETEKAIGSKIDLRYREFLRFANGWQGFFQYVDLFGTNDLSGSEHKQRAEELLDSLAPLEAACGIERQDCTAIAVSRDSIDVFFIANAGSANPGAVYWFAGQLIEQFENFDEFFLAMVDYNRSEAESLGGTG